MKIEKKAFGKISINLSKLDKSKFWVGENGDSYCSFTMNIFEKPTEGGRHFNLCQELTREESEQKKDRTVAGWGTFIMVDGIKVAFDEEKLGF